MIEMIIEQRRRSLGGGLEVGRVLPFAKRRMVGPFVFFDHMGPLDMAPGVSNSVDVRRIPISGFRPSPICSPERSCIATASARRWRSAPTR